MFDPIIDVTQFSGRTHIFTHESSGASQTELSGGTHTKESVSVARLPNWWASGWWMFPMEEIANTLREHPEFVPCCGNLAMLG